MFSTAIPESTISVSPRPGRLERTPGRIKLPIAFLLGAVLALATPGIDMHWAAWCGLSPLIVLTRAATNRSQAFFTGLSFGAGYYAVALSFFFGLYPLSWLGVHDAFAVQLVAGIWLVEILHYSLLIGAFSLAQFCLPLRLGFIPGHKRPYFPFMLSLPFIWIFLQWVLAPSRLFLGSPVSQLAYTQANNLPLIQVASIGGSACIDFIIVAANCALAQIIIEFSDLARRLGQRTDQLNTKIGVVFDIALVAVVLAFITSWGNSRVKRIEEEIRPERAARISPQSPPVAVAVIQNNISIEEEKFNTVSINELIDRLKGLTDDLGSTMVILPEGTINSDQSKPHLLKDYLRDLADKQKKEILVGIIEPRNDNKYINGVRIFSPAKPKESIYAKQLLTPVGESLPFVLNQVKQKSDAKNFEIKSFDASTKTKLVDSVFGDIGIAISNEVIYPKLMADRARRGASLFVVAANLGWFHNSSLNRQLLACATLRAVENKRYLILATNTGISSIIDPAGVVSSRSYPLKRGVLLDTVQFIYSKTPFTKLRWL